MRLSLCDSAEQLRIREKPKVQGQVRRYKRMANTRYALPRHPDFTRSAMSPRERELRSRAAQLISNAGLLHGSWIERKRTCRRASCCCAEPGDNKHSSTYVYRHQDSKLRQLSVTRDQRDTVKRWLEQDRELRQILEELWEIHWQRVRAHQAKS